MTNEIWKDVPGYEGLYQISHSGQIKRLGGVVNRKNGTNITVHEKYLIPQAHSKYGHLRIALWKDGCAKFFGIHNLVMLTFVGECPKGMEIRHLNGNPYDNNISNLQYGTRSENMIDTSKFGRCHNQKLSAADVLDIRKRHSNGDSMSHIAKDYGVNSGSIHSIITNKSYKWVQNSTYQAWG